MYFLYGTFSKIDFCCAGNWKKKVSPFFFFLTLNRGAEEECKPATQMLCFFLFLYLSYITSVGNTCDSAVGWNMVDSVVLVWTSITKAASLAKKKSMYVCVYIYTLKKTSRLTSIFVMFYEDNSLGYCSCVVPALCCEGPLWLCSLTVP